jgi:hypothetical protein
MSVFVVGGFVGAAHGAAIFFGNKRSDALALHNKLLNEQRDEDRDEVFGFESRAARGRSPPRWAFRPPPSTPPQRARWRPSPPPPGTSGSRMRARN